jgi:uncharacterized OB-fold protein
VTEAAQRPLPVPDAVSAPFWEAAARHVLVLARCGRCQAFTHPPDVICPNCHSDHPAFAFVEVPGVGRVRSWTVMRQSFLPGLNDHVPFLLVDVELAVPEGIRLIGRLLDGVDIPLHVGDHVRVAFEDISPGVSVPAFSLAN